MRFKSQRFDAGYEGQFRVPMFELSTGSAELLSALYSAISPRWAIAANDMQVIGGASVGDMRARINMFRGHGTIEVSAERLLASFTGAIGKQDLDVVTDTTMLALGGFETWARDKQSWSRDPKFEQEIIRFTQYLDFVAAADEVAAFFESIASTHDRFRVADYSASDVRASCKIELTNGADVWRLNINLERSWGAQTTSALLMADATFGLGTSRETLTQKRSLVADCITRFLSDIGLVPDDSSA